MCPCVLYSPRGDEIAQMACARVCCILLEIAQMDVPLCAVFSEIAQMVCARVCCILLGETRLLKWHVPVCAVFS